MERKTDNAGRLGVGKAAIHYAGEPERGGAGREEHRDAHALSNGDQHALFIRFGAHDLRCDGAVHLRQTAVVERGAVVAA